MQGKELREKIDKIRLYQRKGKRALHKPLLLLYALGRISRGEPRLMAYEEVVEDLSKLLSEYSPYDSKSGMHYPFVRLCNDDGLWEIKGKKKLDTLKNQSDSVLIDNNTLGGFSVEVFETIKNNKALLKELAQDILNKYFAETLHSDILVQVGLGLETTLRNIRNPDFRNSVLRAYEYRCAVCGFDVRVGNTLIALEAAHIKWHCYGGPDKEDNGIALCTMHHKLFDRGAFTVDKSFIFKVAENTYGTSGFNEWLMRFHGKPIRSPQRHEYKPKKEYIAWHIKEVFQGPSRYVV